MKCDSVVIIVIIHCLLADTRGLLCTEEDCGRWKPWNNCVTWGNDCTSGIQVRKREFYNPDEVECPENAIETRSCTTCACASVTMVTRSEWGASPPSGTIQMHTSVSKVFIHHTVTPSCLNRTSCSTQMKKIQHMHMVDKNPPWTDIGYSWLIGEDGAAYEGRGWTASGAHTYAYNSVSLGISYIGNFMERAPNAAAILAGQNLIACGVEKGYIQSGYELRGHRDVKCTLCPGDKLYANIQSWPQFTTTPIKKYGC